MKRLFYHPESESYFWDDPANLEGGGVDAALCADVTGDREHERRAWQSGVKGVLCPYCGELAKFVDSVEIYGRSYGMVYLCGPCDAWVGVHEGTDIPLGRLANKALREAKKRAHAAFDPLWNGKMRRDGCSKTKARKAGYQWLARQLGIRASECHIGMFDEEMCDRVVEACRI